MIADTDLPSLIDGLRKTLIAKATILNRREAETFPGIVAERRRKVTARLDAAQDLIFDPDMSDDVFWRIAATKPFYAHHRAAAVEKREPAMLGYLGDRIAVCGDEWSEGGSAYTAFMDDDGCYKHDEQLQMVVNAARSIARIMSADHGAADLAEMTKRSFPTFMLRILDGLPDWTSRASLETIHDRLSGLLGFPFVTTFHLMTDLGLPVVKPDQVVMRAAVRLGLFTEYRTSGGRHEKLRISLATNAASQLGQKPDAVWALQEMFQHVAEVTGYSVRHLDYILVKLGQEPDEPNGFARTICGNENPNCNMCIPAKICDYGSRKR